jgi:O-antigen/teichoic acid export membrane protein
MSLSERFRNAFKWSFFKTVIGQFLSPALRLIVIPIIGTYNYGVFGIVFIYFGLLEVLMGAGIRDFVLSKSIKDNIQLKMLNSISFIWSILFLALSILLSFFIYQVYDSLDISRTLLIMSFTFPFIGLGLVSEAVTVRDLKFKKIFFIDMIPFLSTLFIVIPLAINGYGLLGLIIGEMSNRIFINLSYIFLNPIWFKWPSKDFFTKVKRFIKWIIGERVLEYLSQTVDVFFISFLSPSIVGVYNLGKNLVNIIFSLVNAPLGNIMLSIFGLLKDSYSKIVGIFLSLLATIITINISIAFLGAIFGYFFFQSFLSDWENLNIVCVYLFLGAIFRRSLWIQRDFLKVVDKLKFYPISIFISLLIYTMLYLFVKPLEIEHFLQIKIIYDASYFLIFIFVLSNLLNTSINQDFIIHFFKNSLFLLLINISFLIISILHIKSLSIFYMIIYALSILLVNIFISHKYLIDNYNNIIIHTKVK